MKLRPHFSSTPLIPALALAATLSACSEAPPSEPTPLTEDAMAAIGPEPGTARETLARAVDDIFTAEGVGETRAVLVMREGEIIAERYSAGYDADTRHISWSMAKTVTAALIGLLISDGKLSLDEPAPVPRWQRTGDARSEITLRHLLQMRSGLEHTEAGSPPYESSEVRMLFLDGRSDMARWAKEQPLEAEPGAKFEYSSNTSVILADIAARALTESDEPEARRKAVADYLHARLFEPLEMTTIVPEFDAAGTFIGGSLMHASARDWARFGEFLRNKGSYKGTQILPRAWAEQMVTPSPASAHYGFQTWLNRKREEAETPHPLFPDRAPDSVFAMIGHMGQYVIVSPEQKLTVVRLGHSNREERVKMLGEVADIFELYP
ncbi:serine hydrolase domain-containing protein [Qipengyuania sp. DGS5-3]|uniref:serine hydrolase domain-containing protein n=1 Tax=Qipengyuania sp. DGS5-3 TaxID=3349632 RepID=UPI0036D40614